ncbi:MAG: hypothetical protein P1U44_01515 [Vicingaceae bacterium]|nr:hypothetical protein [Vicingaceae bacterium]
MSKYLSLILCFKKESFNGIHVYGFVKDKLPFDPKEIYVSGITYGNKKFSQTILNKINTEDVFSVNLYGVKEQGWKESLTITEVAHRNYGQVIYLTCLADKDLTEIIKSYVSHPSFIVGYLFDTEDEYFQSANNPTPYNVKGVSVPQDKIYIDEYGEEAIDISRNPGRRKLVSEMWLMSCWRMWFGKHFYKHVPKERLLSFTPAKKVEELENEVTHIQLYENPFEAAKTKNREIQQAFRDWINMNELEEKLK